MRLISLRASLRLRGLKHGAAAIADCREDHQSGKKKDAQRRLHARERGIPFNGLMHEGALIGAAPCSAPSA